MNVKKVMDELQQNQVDMINGIQKIMTENEVPYHLAVHLTQEILRISYESCRDTAKEKK